MSQTSSGPPDISKEILPPECPPLHERGISTEIIPKAVDTSVTVTRADLPNTEFLLQHPAPKRPGQSHPSNTYPSSRISSHRHDHQHAFRKHVERNAIFSQVQKYKNRSSRKALDK
ncbi:hypothetical protein CDAR_209791 [Caerostris darwini]|uniref:Uncharacterized protein n=1 Tax=Caerostris darwini TaxID=1538125 RepID=A0AAV4T1E4_9ARAC|nr:hypothetical protein CDAR_209791 [Caerostris darwini]